MQACHKRGRRTWSFAVRETDLPIAFITAAATTLSWNLLPFCNVPAVSLTPRSQQPSSKFNGISNPDHLSARVAKGQHNLVKAGTPRGVPFFQQGTARLGSKEKESRERKSGISPPAFWNSIRQVLRCAHIHPSYFFVVDRINALLVPTTFNFTMLMLMMMQMHRSTSWSLDKNLRAYPAGARSVLNITINAYLDTVNSTAYTLTDHRLIHSILLTPA